jgi:hypothetical protein
MTSWIAYHRSEESEELQARHPNAFLLLCQIARRARWKPCPITKLEPGQALVGDWKKAGLPSQQAYRCAKATLEKAQLATFQGTTRGTVATLCSSSVFSLSEIANNERNTKQGTNEERSNNDQTTTNIQGYQETKITKNRKIPKAVEIPSELSGAGFLESWNNWLSHRNEIKKPLTPTSTVQQLKKLATMGETRAIEAINHSIGNGWTGIFEPKSDATPNNGKTLNLGRRGHSNSYNESTSLDHL